MRTIETLATTPNGEDPVVDEILDNSVVLFNVIQNPDGRVAGMRANGNGFDLNRDFLTQSQSETKASVSIMQEWIPPETIDLHGYATPTLIEATTKPHNPSIEYDLWLKWNQARLDANEAALTPRATSSSARSTTGARTPTCRRRAGSAPAGRRRGLPSPRAGTTGARSTRRCTPSSSASTARRSRCAESDDLRAAARAARARSWPQYVATWSTLAYDVANREDLLHDKLEIYRRGVTDAARPACCPPPFDVDNNWMASTRTPT